MTMVRNIYSTTGISGTGLFFKKYDDKIPKKKVFDEFIKSKSLYDLSKKTKLFVFPEPIYMSNNIIYSEKIDDFQELRYYLVHYNNILLVLGGKLERVMRNCGKALGVIHNKLKLDRKEGLGWDLPVQKKVFLYADFGLSSILVKNDESIVLIDPSFNLINNNVFLYDSFYFDLAYFIFQLKYLIPLRLRIFYLRSNVGVFITNFLLGYRSETGFFINNDLLQKYEARVKEEYLKTLKGLRGMVWKKILLRK